MEIAAHIAFYYDINRILYLDKTLQNLSNIQHNVKIFIYSNRNFNLNSQFANLDIEIICVKFLSKKSLIRHIPFIPKRFLNPFYLTWENRKYVKKNIDQFDIQIYLEDDIGFTDQTLNYWLEYKDLCIKNNYNLGFLRYEVDTNTSDCYYTDLTSQPKKTITLEKQLFLLNDNNPYCGFWIYDKKELKRFIKSKEWKFKFSSYDIREKSAIGWHALNMKRYKGTIIPLQNKNPHITSRGGEVHHYPNNYIGHSVFASIKVPLEVIN